MWIEKTYPSSRFVRCRPSNHEINPPLNDQHRSRDPNDRRDRNLRGYTMTHTRVTERISTRRTNTWGKNLKERTRLTDIAPHGCPIHDIPVPYDRIDEPHEGGKPCPENEQTCASVPARSFSQVPCERDRGRGEGEQGEDGEYVVNGGHSRVLEERNERGRWSLDGLLGVGGSGVRYRAGIEVQEQQ